MAMKDKIKTKFKIKTNTKIKIRIKINFKTKTKTKIKIKIKSTEVNFTKLCFQSLVHYFLQKEKFLVNKLMIEDFREI